MITNFTKEESMRWFVIAVVAAAGCGTVIEPGHRGLLFKPRSGGLQHDVLGPGWWRLAGIDTRIDDFDVTFSTRKEELHVVSKEGAEMTADISIRYRPIIAELYDLDVEVGPEYYDEVIGPELRSATRGLFARHSYLGLLEQNEKLEDEIEKEVQRRVAGKHLEVSSVTMDRVTVAPDVMHVNQERILGEQEALRKRTADDDEAKRVQADILHKREEDNQRTAAELALREHQRQLAEAQSAIDKEKVENEAAVAQALAEAETSTARVMAEKARAEAEASKVRAQADADDAVIKAKGDAQALMVMAKARAEQKRAEAATVTPMEVMMHAYDALGKLGGANTTVMMGDFSKLPNWLFPQLPAFSSALLAAPHAPVSDGRPADHKGAPLALRARRTR